MKQSRLSPGSTVWLVARHSPGTAQSIHSQLAALHDHCRQNGLTVVDEFVDAGESGANRDRPEFTRMRRMVEASPVPLVDGVIIYDGSRLDRDFEDAQYTRWLLRRRGYVLESLIGDDHEGLPGAIMEVVTDYHNAEFIEMIRQKSRDGLRAMLRLKGPDGNYLGFWPGGVPWGFRGIKKVLPVIDTVTGQNRVKQCIEPDYDLWPLGRELFRLRAGGLTYNEIEARTRFLERRGTPSAPHNGDVVARSYNVFFRNAIYYGELHFKEIIIPDYVPAMIGRELWDAANITGPAKHQGRPARAGKTKYSFLLAGLIECGCCGAPFYTKTTAARARQHRYYICRTKRQAGASACRNRHVNAARLEQAVYDNALAVYFDPDFVIDLVERINELLAEIPDTGPALERERANLADLDRRIANLVKLAEIGDEVAERLRELKRRQAETRRKIEELERLQPVRLEIDRAEVTGILEEFRDRFETETKMILNRIIEKIVITPEGIVIHYRSPLCFCDNYRLGVVDIPQPGYVIELPMEMAA